MIRRNNLTVTEKLRIHKKAREVAEKLAEQGLSAFIGDKGRAEIEGIEMTEYVYEITINNESTPYSCMDVSLEAAILQVKGYLCDDSIKITKVICLGEVEDEDE